ncbi:LamG-like jellyroll fold domain-containing protein [Elusimicrobiota bacterium]
MNIIKIGRVHKKSIKMLNAKRNFFLSIVIIIASAGSVHADVSTWTFTTPENYTYDSNKIEITGGKAKLIVIDQTDDDNTELGFSSGTHNETQWDGVNSWLELTGTGQNSGTGTFTSRVLDVGTTTAWGSIQWIPERPLYKELPDSGVKETDYSTGAVDMSANILLMHLNESAGVSGQAISDTSGEDNSSIFTHTGSGGMVSGGRFNNAAYFDGSGDYIDCGNDSSLNVQDLFTIEAWLKTDLSSESTIVSKKDGNPFPGYNLRIANTGSIRINLNHALDGWKQGYKAINDNKWHHIAWTFDGSSSTIYIDGQLDRSFVMSTTAIPTTNLYIGKTAYDGTSFQGIIDEVSISSRALSSEEVFERYMRGTVRVQYQVKSGAGNPPIGNFIGPDGSTSTYYSELNNQTASTPTLNITNLADNRYFQYKAYMETSISTYSPELKSVKIGPLHYPGDTPTVVNVSSVSYIALNGFTGLLDAGTVRYQISNNGNSWYWWNGSTWIVGIDYTKTNTAVEIDSNISDFRSDVGAGWFYFKAFLYSGTTSQVELNQISVDCTPNTTPDVFSLSSPPNNSAVNSRSPVFDWDDSDAGASDSSYGDWVKYEIRYSTESDFSVYTSSMNLSTSTFTPAVNLDNFTTYYWRVYAYDSFSATTTCTQTDWKIYIDTNTAPAAFDLVSPSNESAVNNRKPVFDWDDSSAGADDGNFGDWVRYELQYSTKSDFSVYTSSISLSTSTFTPSADLDNFTTYYWRVYAYDSFSSTVAGNQTNWWIYIITNTVPAAFDLTSPSDGQEVNSRKPAFDWDDSNAGADDGNFGDWVKYEVRYSTASDFSVYASSMNLSTSTFTPAVNLDNFTTYYWRVYAYDSYSGTTTGTQTNWKIYVNTNTEPIPFSLTSPSDGSTENNRRPSFDWNESSAGADDGNFGDWVRYEVQYGTKSDFSVYTSSMSLSTSTFTPAADLDNFTTYYWRVYAYDSYSATTTSTQTDWSVYIETNTAPAAFSLTDPADELEVSNRKPVFDWNNSSAGADDVSFGDWVKYEIRYSTKSDFSVYTSSLSLSTSTFTPAAALNNFTTYYWRVYAYDSFSSTTAGTQAGWWVYIASNTLPAAFSLTSPADEGTVSSRRPEFDWADSSAGGSDSNYGDWVRYEMQYSTASDFSVYTSSISLSSSTFTPAGNLNNFTTYYWRVYAYDSFSSTTAGNQTDWWVFIASNTPPATFNLTSPANEISTNTRSHTFDWGDSDAGGSDSNYGDWVKYELQYSTRSDFSVYTSSINLDASIFAPGVALNNFTTYYWRVYAYDSYSATVTSNQTNWWVYIISNTLPAVFDLTSPADETKISGRTTAFDWDDSDAGGSDSNYADWVKYEIRYGTKSDFSVYTSSISLSTSTFTPNGNLDNFTTYFWRVYAYDSYSGTTTSTQINWKIYVDTNTEPIPFSLTSPSDGSTENNRRPAFDWNNSSAGADDGNFGDWVRYEVQYGTKSDFSIYTSSMSLSTSTFTPAADLDNFTTYYWRIYAYDSYSDSVTSTQTDWKVYIETNTAPTAFSLTDPSDESVENNRKPVFDWTNSSAGADDGSFGDWVKYEIRYGTASDFSVYTSSKDLSASTFTPAADLDNFTTYYWRVYAYDSYASTKAGTQTGWWVYIITNTVPAAFDLTSPSDGLEVNSRKPTFDWEDSDAGGSDASFGDWVKYEMRYSTASDFSVYTSSIGLSTSTFTPAADLDNFTTYYWRVYAYDSFTGSMTSTQIGWKVYIETNTAPSSFNLVSPANGSTESNRKPSFNWSNSSAGADDGNFGDWVKYDIRLSTKSDFSVYQSSSDLSASAFTQVSNLDNFTTYYWRVYAYDSFSATTTSNETNWNIYIETNAQPGTFDLTSPANDEIVTTKKPVFDWADSNAGADDASHGDWVKYKIIYSTWSDYSVYASSMNLSTSTYTQPTDLQENGRYYWRVEAYDSFSSTTASNQVNRYFWVNKENEAPPAFNLSSPGDGSAASTTTVVFDWNISSDPDPKDAAKYNLYYSTYQDFTSSVTVKNISISSNTIEDLVDNTTYYWNVQAYDTGAASTTWGSNQSTWSFMVQVPPLPPQNLTALDVPADGGGEIYLGWTKSPDDGGGWDDVIKYSIYRSTYNGGYVLKSTVTANTTYYNDATVLDEISYYYVVRSSDQYNESVNSNVASVIAVDDIAPGAITDLSASRKKKGGSVVLSWTCSGDDGSTGTITSGKYKIRWATSPVTNWNSGSWDDYGRKYSLKYSMDAVPGEIGTRTIEDLYGDTTYYFRIWAADEALNWSNISNAATAWVKILSGIENIVPMPPAGVKVVKVKNNGNVVLRWKKVELNTNGKSYKQHKEYRIMRSKYINKGWKLMGTVSKSRRTYEWEDTSANADSRVRYYKVIARNIYHNDSEDSSIVDTTEEFNIIVLSSDKDASIEIPKEVSAMLYSETNEYKEDVLIEIVNENFSDENTLKEYSFRAISAKDGDVIKSGVFDKARAKISIGYQTSKGKIKGAPRAISVTEADRQLSLYWFNGVEWLKIGGKVDEDANTVSIYTKSLGKYALGVSYRGDTFNILSIQPDKIFTPKAQYMNFIEFKYENPKEANIAGKIYDIRGAYIADMVLGNTASIGNDSGSFVWDGKDSSGSYVPSGVYIYQIEVTGAEEKIINGTVVVAR